MENVLMSTFLKHVSQQEAVITFQVYMELCEVKRYYNISYTYNNTIGKFILFASKSKNAPLCTFVPSQVHEEMTFSKMRNMSLLDEHGTVYIVIVHPDSTCVYYQIKEGLMEPTEITAKHLKENRQEKLDADIRKNRQLLQHAALIGVPVTLKKEQKDKT